MARQKPRSTKQMIRIPSCLLVSLITCGNVAAAPSWQQCQHITNDQQRLQCFDQWAATQGSRQAPVSIAPPMPATAPASVVATATMQPPQPNQQNSHVSTAVVSAAQAVNIERSSVHNTVSSNDGAASSSDESFGKNEPPQEKTALDSIQLTVAEVSVSKHQLLTIKFKEGQTWRQINAERFLVKPNDRCTIKQGLFGSYILKVDGANRSTKVRRVD